MKIQYEWIPGQLAHPEFLQRCSELYSEHYGIWSNKSQISPGSKIHLSPERIRQWLLCNDIMIAYAQLENKELIGYAFVLRVKVPKGIISWVTQLVVHTDYRKIDVGKTLLFSIWGFSDHFAWGLVSANPYAVRAL